ncbi:MAG: hypothetical protein IJS59_08075 [Bacteroidaceae bacterium]|nr:hypothetical protein [Bacteroidaceae bacterium]
MPFPDSASPIEAPHHGSSSRGWPTVAAVKRTKKQWSEMTGTYVAGTLLESQKLFISGNKFWYCDVPVEAKRGDAHC